MIVDLEKPSPNVFNCDVAIVGSGAVGIPIAVELARQKISVVLIEAGGSSLETNSQNLYEAKSIGHELDGLQNGRFRLLGGTTNFWGGQLVRFDPHIFENRAWLNLSGWPISRSTLEPYYGKALDMVGMKEWQDDHAVFHKAGIPTPQLGSDIEVFLTRWLKNPNFAQIFKKEIDSDAFATLVHANLVSLNADTSGVQIDELRLRTLTGRKAVVRPRIVVLACGTIEISRLLQLPFADGRIPSWNSNFWLGKAFLDHLDCTAGTVHLRDGKSFHDIFDNIFLKEYKFNPKLKLTAESQAALRSLDIAGHFRFESTYTEHLENFKILLRALRSGRIPPNLWSLPSHVMALWRVVFPLAVRYIRANRMFNPSDAGISFILTGEQFPSAKSKISLDKETDVLGIPKVSVEWNIDGRELETMAKFSEIVRDQLAAMGLAEIEIDPRLLARDVSFLDTIHDGNHQMGGARMATSVDEGVVDANLKVFGTHNLYVAGAATYPCSGFSNPTFTAIALGLRLADHLAASSR